MNWRMARMCMSHGSCTLPQNVLHVCVAVQILRHLAQGISRALGCLPQQQWPPHGSLPLQPSSWVGALLRETAAATAAVTHWEPLLAAAGATGDVSGGWVKGMDWECLDACMALTGLLCSPTAAADGTQQQPAAAANGTAGAALGCMDQQLLSSLAGRCGAERLPAGVLQQGVLVAVLVEALEALQWTAPDALLHLLRCVRRVWALAVHDQGLQATALQALSDAGLVAASSSDDSTPAEPLVPLAASLGRNLLQVLQGTKKRPLVLCGTLVNTLMLPELMLCDPQQHPTCVSLHAGPEAPLRRFVAGLLQQGPRASKGSPALHVVVALRLGACIPSAPQLLGWYADELRHLLLFGGTMEAGLETKVSLVADCHLQPSGCLVEQLSCGATYCMLLRPSCLAYAIPTLRVWWATTPWLTAMTVHPLDLKPLHCGHVTLLGMTLLMLMPSMIMLPPCLLLCSRPWAMRLPQNGPCWPSLWSPTSLLQALLQAWAHALLWSQHCTSLQCLQASSSLLPSCRGLSSTCRHTARATMGTQQGLSQEAAAVQQRWPQVLGCGRGGCRCAKVPSFWGSTRHRPSS
jgi:hypothetical protein